MPYTGRHMDRWGEGTALVRGQMATAGQAVMANCNETANRGS
jgi:hypothetical protein